MPTLAEFGLAPFPIRLNIAQVLVSYALFPPMNNRSMKLKTREIIKFQALTGMVLLLSQGHNYDLIVTNRR